VEIDRPTGPSCGVRRAAEFGFLLYDLALFCEAQALYVARAAGHPAKGLVLGDLRDIRERHIPSNFSRAHVYRVGGAAGTHEN